MANREDYDYITVLREEYRDLVVAQTKIDVLVDMIENYKYVGMGDVINILGLRKKEEDK